MSTETTTTATTKPTNQERRDKLKGYSNIARGVIESEGLEMTINEYVLNHFYKDAENQEFNTLWQWKDKGFKVVKGALAFAVWGKPKALQKEAEAGAEPDEGETEFYPLCYLFSNAQVEPLEAKK